MRMWRKMKRNDMKVTIRISVRVFIDVALAHFRIDMFVRIFNNYFYWIADKIGIAAEKEIGRAHV